jgi:hypothetical protein
LNVDNGNEGLAASAQATGEQSDGSNLHTYPEGIIDLDGDGADEAPKTETDTTDDHGDDAGAAGDDGNGDDGDGDDGEGNSDDSEGRDGEGDDEGAGEEGDKSAEADKGKKRSGVSRLKARIQALEERLAEASKAPAVNVNDKAALAAEVEKRIGPAPKPEDFPDDYLAYEREAAAWALDRRQTERSIKSEVTKAATTTTEAAGEKLEILVESHQSRLAALEKVLPGSKAAIGNLRKTMEAAGHEPNMAQHVGELMLESEKSALLALHFTKNPGELAKLNGMSERAATREITRLEGRLSLPQPRTQTKAPPPLTRVSGTTQGNGFSPEKASMDSYAANFAKRRGRG